jgi:Xaa-Pro aminopeptidase
MPVNGRRAPEEEMGMERLREIQEAIGAEGVDGWLLYDFRGLNPIARATAGVPDSRFLTRRWACFVPATGAPRWLIHAIEVGSMVDLAPEAAAYVSWGQWSDGLRALLAGARRVAMEVSPGAAIPYVSRVDAGTVELVRGLGVEVVTSADLVQVSEAVWTAPQLAGHRRAARELVEIQALAFGHAGDGLRAGMPVTEYGLQEFMMTQFARRNLVTDHPPIVGVNEHAADPHFAPRRDPDTTISRGDLLLIDLWAREAVPDSVYADITWVGFAGENPSPRVQEVFDVVRRARDSALAFAADRLSSGQQVRGYEVDDACRAVVAAAGLADRFIHRTGHSLGVTGHGNGVNIDNLETQDKRRLIPGVAFTIEPGVYLPAERIGVRLEVDCYVGPSGLEVTTLPLQDQLVLF